MSDFFWWKFLPFYYRQFIGGVYCRERKRASASEDKHQQLSPERRNIVLHKLKQIIYWFNWVQNLKIIDDKSDERVEWKLKETIILSFWLREIIRHNLLFMRKNKFQCYVLQKTDIFLGHLFLNITLRRLRVCEECGAFCAEIYKKVDKSYVLKQR